MVTWMTTSRPEKKRLKPTLDFFQRHFHLAQRSVASKGYLETITWSFTDEKIKEAVNRYKEFRINNSLNRRANYPVSTRFYTAQVFAFFVLYSSRFCNVPRCFALNKLLLVLVC